MQTVQVGHAPLVGTTAAVSAFVWLLGLAYLYVELTTDERAMGVLVTIMLAVLYIIPALDPQVNSRPEVLRSPRSLIQLGILSDDSPVLQFVETHLANAHLFIYGILVVLVILFAPDGVLGLIRTAAARWRRRRHAEEPAPGVAGAPGRAP